MGEFRMPSLGADMDEATLLEWQVKAGDPVHRGDVLAVVDTAKTAMEIEAFEEGTIEQLLVEPGAVLAVGAPMAVIATEVAAGAPKAAPVPKPAPAPKAAAKKPAAAAPRPPHPPSPLARRRARAAAAPASAPAVVHAATPSVVRAAPRARRQASLLGVDLAAIQGTGPDGAVTAADVERAAAATSVPVQRPASSDRSDALKAATAALMARSKREIPHYYLRAEVDLKALTTWLTEQNAGLPVTERIVPAAALLKAVALAARHVPEVNGFWVDEAFVRSPSVHLGVAVSLRGGGLVAPAIHDVDQLTVPQVMAALQDLVERARAGRLRQSEMADPTLTVTNLGDMGVDEVYGVIYPPQVALVGFGKVIERPVAVDGMLAVHPVVTATLSADHRVSEGHRGSRFLSRLDDLLQHPDEL